MSANSKTHAPKRGPHKTTKENRTCLQPSTISEASQQDLNSDLIFIRRGLLDLGMQIENAASILSLHGSPSSRYVALNRLNCVADMLDVLLFHLQTSLGENGEVGR